ncbi:MAG: PTS system fructose-specific EIIABC component [Planctomycetes bacterium ADurb.Bin401]|nr:MAG: PTS system fructose-specific EIIABC component [Planctomycetes bacterium ADurb.Bin401]
MVLTQILEPTCVKVPVEGTNKETAIKELVDLLDAEGLLINRDQVYQAVLTRESTKSTGIGFGIAIPHGKCSGVKELVMAVGISHQGIDFHSIDGKPVHIIVLLASPIDRTGPHIQALARISRLMLDEEFKNKLQNSQSSEELFKLISEKEAE